MRVILDNNETVSSLTVNKFKISLASGNTWQTYSVLNGKKMKKSLILKCYFSEKLRALHTLHKVVPTWYSFHS